MAFVFKYTDVSDDDSKDDTQILLKRQRDLQHAWRVLKTTVHANADMHAQLNSAMTTIEGSMSVINERAVRDVSPERFTQYCPPHATGLAQNVFDIPELLEEMLEYLDIDDSLTAQMVNRQFRDAVNSSIRLQRRLSLLPHTSKHFSYPLAKLDDVPGMLFTIKKVPKVLGHPQSLSTVTIEAKIVGTPKLGSRCRRILLVQPPVQSVSAWPDCCRYRQQEEEDHLVVNEAGITVGDLIDHATMLAQCYQNCCEAPPNDYDSDDGHLMLGVEFQAVLTLDIDDPTYKRRLARHEKKEASRADESYRRRMMSQWVNRRQDGKLRPSSTP